MSSSARESEDGTTVAKKGGNNNAGGAFRSFCRVFTYTDRLGWVLNSVALVCMVVSGTLLPLMDLIFGKFVTVFTGFAVGTVSPDEFRNKLNQYTLYYVYLFVAKFALTYAWTVLVSVAAIRTTTGLRTAFLRQTLRQDVAFFDAGDGAGGVAGQVTTNGNLVAAGLSEKLGLVVQAMATFVAAFVVAFAVQWKLTLIVLAIVPAIVGVTGACVVPDTRIENGVMALYAAAGRLAEEVFASVRTAHAFWAYPKLEDKFDAILEEARVLGMRKCVVWAIMFSTEFFCVFSGYGLAFWQGIRMLARGEIPDSGSIVTVILCVVIAAQALTQIAPQTVTLSKAMAAAHELFQTIDRTSAIDALSTEGHKPASCAGDIQFSNVTFAYPSRPDSQVLKGLTLSLPAGKTTALVGASGSGKSTIVALLERWFTPLSGTITLDGTPIADLNPAWLRTRARLVQQEPTLFSGTVFDNVCNGLAGTAAFGLPEPERRRLVEQACRRAHAHEFVERLPRGYDTALGERGATLSGGQRQRLVIARAIVADPPVLLLDEATSALDPAAEAVVQRALNDAAVGRTTVVIAHRLATVRTADKIVVMREGEIVEQGTHEELMASQGEGAYKKLVKMQDLGKRVDESEESGQGGEEKDTPQMLVPRKTESRVDAHALAVGSEVTGDGPEELGLLRCIIVIFGEQRGVWFSLFMLLLACLAAGGAYPAIGILFSRIMTAFELPGPDMVTRGDFYSLMFFMVAIGNFVAYGAIGWYSNIVSQVVAKSYRQQMFRSILRQEMSFFDATENSTGALVSRLSTEPTNLVELLSQNITVLALNLVNIVASCVLAIAIGWKLGLVLVFGALPPLVGAGYLRIKLELQLERDTGTRFANSAGLAGEAVMAIRTVSSLAMEQVVLDRFSESVRGIAERSIRSLGWKMFWYALSQSISFLAMGLGFWYGGRLMSTGEYTSSQFYLVFIVVIFSGEATALLFQYTTSMAKAKGAANYIFRLRAQVPQYMHQSPSEEEENEKDEDSGAAVECRDVEFAYPLRPKLKVLRGINTSIRPGQFVAFVGPSGCGKTTMVGLLERFYSPTSGCIMLNGTDITAVHPRTYRSSLSLVQQEPVLYQGSIRENVLLGLPSDADVSDETVLAACEQANIATFVLSLPEGLNTPAGTSGLQLSGGQRQRIALARALVRKPKLLLLDEATSALDAESERVVKEALDRAAREGGRTTVAVAHRLASIRDADVIFVFQKGRIVESGRHEELVAHGGVYHQMCLGQSLDRAV